MAAHLEGLSAAVLDLTGLAQKGGTVVSHIRLAPAGPARPRATGLAAGRRRHPVRPGGLGGAGLAGRAAPRPHPGHREHLCGSGVGVHPRSGRGHAPEALLAKIRHAAGDAHTAAIDAHAAALALFGDSILSNMFMLGYAWQRGGVPLSHAAINRAIELNGVAVAANRAAFDSGRLAAHQPDALSTALRRAPGRAAACAGIVRARRRPPPGRPDRLPGRRLRPPISGRGRAGRGARTRTGARRQARLALAVARSLFKLMAYRTSMKWRGSTLATRSGPSSRTSSKANTACASTWRRRSSRARIRAPACRAR